MSDQPPLSRYERVKQILSDAQGSTIPDYQGYKAFWLLPLAEFLQVELYGQRMIAPDAGDQTAHDHSAHIAHDHSSHEHHDHSAPDHDDHCEHCAPAAPASSTRPQGYVDAVGAGTVMDAPTEKRSDRSALIIGLRGQFPFDGSQFPPLLWQAAHPVSSSDIAFIAQWIDDGCPETEEATIAVAASRQQTLLALARGDLPHALSMLHPSEDRDKVSGLRVRKEITSLTALELEALRDAIQKMYTYDPYWQDERSFGYWARIHADACKHGSELFLPWHRVYLYFFEQQLQDYNPNIMLPYWDWAAYANQNQPPQKLTLDAGVIPDAYQCWLNDDGLTALKRSGLFNEAEIAGLEGIKDTTYNSGRRLMVAALGTVWQITASPTWRIDHRPQIEAIQNTLRDINPLWHAIRWPGLVGGGKVTSYPAEATIDKILEATPFSYFGGGPEDDHHFGVLEEVHNGMHNFSGGANPDFPAQGGNQQDPYNPPSGDMTDNRTTAYDPIFWAHHCNVDRLWAVWQDVHGKAGPDELDAILVPWSMTVEDALSIKKLGYEYMKDTYFYPTQPDTPSITRFQAEKTAIRPAVLENHQRAEIRLHRVQKARYNATIRAFLNAPDANADTPIDNNPNYVGSVTTFGGTCVGGPGHCDVPAPRQRRFDRRQMHHNEPTNFRIDATKAVQDMVAQGEQELSVHLVVVGIDGTPQPGALYFDGVSLNFLD